MDIKWKKFQYNIFTKTVIFILACFAFSIFCISSYNLLILHDPFRYENYYETYNFQSKIYRYTHNVIELNAKLINDESVKQYLSGKNVDTQNVRRYKIITERLLKNKNFIYYIKDNKTGKIVTNIVESNPLEIIKLQPVYMYDNQWNPYYYSTDLLDMINQTNIKVYTAVRFPLKSGDEFYDGYMKFENDKKLVFNYKIALYISLSILFLAFIYFLITAGKKGKDEDIKLLGIDKIPIEISTILTFIATFVSVMICRDFNGVYSIALISFIDAIIGITYVLSIIKLLKVKKMWEYSFIYKSMKALNNLFFNNNFKKANIALFAFYGIINGILFYSLCYFKDEFVIFTFFVFLIIAFNFAFFCYFSKFIVSIQNIIDTIEEISSGNIDYERKGEILPEFKYVMDDILNIQSGFKNALNEAVKGERMKTELITNVSHDLKTPLTSIINYVDLLKKEGLDEKTKREYTNILNEKSQRLKQLIDDLIEFSKASSGNLNIDFSNINLHDLIVQSLGEFEEKIKKAELEVVVNCTDKNILVNSDGKYLWRIIENLLSNAVKYSMKNSRIYIDVLKDDAYGIFSIKNISAYSLNIPAEKLIERFVRGDVSRSSDGSGLGLSIANSLTEALKGIFNVEIDGDLFKVTVKIPLKP
ncbi:MAG: HAMP domain-containing histidine kinase [Caloramator sp.]|nr:HAMP domain-containing histidine kinase [Caloramator sp.]